MKRLFFTVIAIIIAVLAIPTVRAFAENTALKDIPMLDNYYTRGGESKKAYCYHEYDGEFYTYTYYNCKTEKVLYKSKDKFSYDASISKNGKIVFYSVNNAVYRYSFADGKTKKIYEDKDTQNFMSVKTSPNGEYCYIGAKNPIFWHGGKTVSPKCAEDTSVCQITDDGRILYDSCDGKIFSFSFETGKSEKIAEVSDDRYFYSCTIFYDSGSYLFCGYNNELQDEDDDDPEYDHYKVIYGGKLYEQPKLLYSGSIDPDSIIACSGRSMIIYDKEYFTRINLVSGVSKKLVKVDKERLGKSASGNFRYSDNLDCIVYIDYSDNKLVRLSKWSDEKNDYTKRQEIELSGTEFKLSCCGNDLTVVEIYIKTDGIYKSSAAFFESGKLVPADSDIIRIDRFNHVICGGQDHDVLEILNPDGSKSKVFGKRYSYYFDAKSGYFIFCTKEATEFDGNTEVGGIYHDYYIGKNGKAVHLWDGRNTYWIDYEWDLWDRYDE